MGRIEDHLPEDIRESLKNPEPNIDELPLEEEPIADDLTDDIDTEDTYMNDPTHPTKEVHDLEQAIMNASEWLDNIADLEWSTLSKETVEKILVSATFHVRSLIKAAPLLDHDGKPTVDDIFGFFRSAEDVLSDVYNVIFRITDMNSFGDRKKLLSDLKIHTDVLMEEHGNWPDVNAILKNTTTIPKTGGGVWTLNNHVRAYDFAIRGLNFRTSMGMARKRYKEFHASMLEQQLKTAKLKDLIARKIEGKGISMPSNRYSGIKAAMSMRIKRWLIDS